MIVSEDFPPRPYTPASRNVDVLVSFQDQSSQVMVERSRTRAQTFWSDLGKASLRLVPPWPNSEEGKGDSNFKVWKNKTGS